MLMCSAAVLTGKFEHRLPSALLFLGNELNEYSPHYFLNGKFVRIMDD